MVSLLPPNATPLERALERTIEATLPGEQADAPKHLKSAPPEAVVPWLAAEWFLADFYAYFPDARALIAAGLPWLKTRGTAAAVKQALSWIGMTATLEEDGARLQLNPGNPAAPAQLAAIKHLVGASIPAHVQLYRLYHGYDLRPLRLDSSHLDGALLDDDSGVWFDGLKLSFGTRHAIQIAADDLPIDGGMTRQYSTRVWDDDSWRLDAWRLDSETLIDAASGMVSQQSAAVPPAADEPPVCARLDFRTALLPLDIESPDLAGRTDQRACSLTDEVRGWAGPWAGAWREPIPSRITFEDA